MKKILMFLGMLFTLFSFVGTSYAAGESAVTMVWVNPAAVSDISGAEERLNAGLKEALKKYGFHYADSAQAQIMMQQYMIENSIVPDDTKTSVGFLPKKADMKAFANELGVQYVVFTNARITDEKSKDSLAFLGRS